MSDSDPADQAIADLLRSCAASSDDPLWYAVHALHAAVRAARIAVTQHCDQPVIDQIVDHVGGSAVAKRELEAVFSRALADMPATAIEEAMNRGVEVLRAVLSAGGADAERFIEVFDRCVAVSSTTDLVAVSTGPTHALLAMRDGLVWGWGSDEWSQLTGDASSTVSQLAEPTLIRGLDPIVDVACGSDHSLAVDGVGRVWAWGADYAGQLGIGRGDRDDDEEVGGPVVIEGLPPISFVRAGDAVSYAVSRDGEVWAWGSNGSGQLGDGSRLARNRPVLVRGLHRPVIDLASGASHVVALSSDGAVWAWGSNRLGQLGCEEKGDWSVPIRATVAQDVIKVAAAEGYSLALHGDGQVSTWGAVVVDGSLDRGTLAWLRSRSPEPIEGLLGATDIAAAATCSFAVTADGALVAWGVLDDFVDAKPARAGSPQEARPGPFQPLFLRRDVRLEAIVAARATLLGITTSGELVTWGHRHAGECSTEVVDVGGQPFVVPLPRVRPSRSNRSPTVGEQDSHGIAPAHQASGSAEEGVAADAEWVSVERGAHADVVGGADDVASMMGRADVALEEVARHEGWSSRREDVGRLSFMADLVPGRLALTLDGGVFRVRVELGPIWSCSDVIEIDTVLDVVAMQSEAAFSRPVVDDTDGDANDVRVASQFLCKRVGHLRDVLAASVDAMMHDARRLAGGIIAELEQRHDELPEDRAAIIRMVRALSIQLGFVPAAMPGCAEAVLQASSDGAAVLLRRLDDGSLELLLPLAATPADPGGDPAQPPGYGPGLRHEQGGPVVDRSVVELSGFAQRVLRSHLPREASVDDISRALAALLKADSSP